MASSIGGVVAVELVDLDGGSVEVGDEGVVPPVRPQLRLGGFGEAGAAHHEPQRSRAAWRVRGGVIVVSATWASPPSG